MVVGSAKKKTEQGHRERGADVVDNELHLSFHLHDDDDGESSKILGRSHPHRKHAGEAPEGT